MDDFMAQNPTNLQEPSMDELLASIREIIEESSAAAEANEPLPAALNNHGPADTFSPTTPIRDEQGGVSEEVSFINTSMPIQDAMKALAARIGLKKSVSSRVSPPKEPTSAAFPPVLTPTISAFSASVPDAAANSTVVRLPLPKQSEAVMAHNAHVQERKVNPAVFEKKLPPQGMPAPSIQQQPLPSMSLSTSVQPITQNAKAEKMQSTKILSASQVSPQSQKTPPTDHIPLYPKFRTAPFKPVAPSSPQQPQSATKNQEGKQELSDLEKGFLAEFEQSAELLLRPYIANWLEEHFHHLFEKILREEIQRLMHKNMRR